MDRNNRRKRSSKRQPKDYVYLLQGLLRCGRCGFKMSPKPGTGRSGDSYHYYHCGNADKSAGLNCAKRYVPADSLDRAVLEFMKRLHVKPELVSAFAEKANESTSGTVQKLKEDHARVRSQLQAVKAKLDHLADAVADGGKAAMRTLKDRIEALELERTELEETESRLQFELKAEQNQEIAAKDQVQTLAAFNDLVKSNEDHPERMKALLPRFVDYVVFHEEAKGEGQLEVALFPNPVAMAPVLEVESGVNGSGPRFAGESQMVVLKGFVEFCHDRGIERNADISKREMRAYMEHMMDRGRSESYLDKVRSACVKFGALYGKYERFRAMSERMGEKIRDLVEDGVIAGPAHQRITAEIADRAIERLAELDAHAEGSRAYHLAAELQRECGLRAIEATERLTPVRLVNGYVIALEKGGKELARPVPPDLYRDLKDYFAESGAACLASEHAYRSAFRGAVLDVGGRSTGTHTLRRLWADEYRSERYREHLAEGMSPEGASEAALADTIEALGHGRDRHELREAYLRSN